MLPCMPKRSRFVTDADIRNQKAMNKEIERLMKKDKKKYRNRHSILLLGTGESGKSTFLKQMKLINGKKFSAEEIARFKDTIYDNIYKGILFLIHAQETMQIDLENEESTRDAITRIENHYQKNKVKHKEISAVAGIIWVEEEFLELVSDFEEIWKDAGIKEAFNNRSMMMTENFSENSRYYLNKLASIGTKNYTPTNEDIVWSRKPTDSIIEEEIETHSTTLLFIDVGGQTKERKKWCRMFEDMNSVLFLIASSHFDEYYYDRMSRENRNKLREAMRVFEDLINVHYFMSVSVLIFFNKYDILSEKVKSGRTSIKTEFEEFPSHLDPQNLEDVKKFLLDSFISFVDNPNAYHHHRASLQPRASKVNSNILNNNDSQNPVNKYSAAGQSAAGATPKRTIYKHFTTAVDRKNIETVFAAMKDTILQRNINQLVMR